MTEQKLDKFEREIAQTARGFAYPRTPVLRSRVETRRIGSDRAAAASLQARLAIAVLVAALALGAVLLAVPSVRAAVLRFLQIGVVQIEVAPATPTATSAVTVFPTPAINTIQLTPTSTPQPLADQLNLFGKTTLTNAQASGIRIKVPLALGEPDAVYFQDVGGNAAILVWFDATRPGKVRISLQVFTNDVFAQKSPPTVVRQTTVKGKAAAWVQGEHILQVRSGDYEAMQLVSANALIWTEDSCTYRLETSLTMDEAVAIAETTP